MTLLIREKFNDQEIVKDFNLPDYDLSVNLYPDNNKTLRHDIVISELDEVSCIILSEMRC